jgi:hypothetical protein
VVSAAGQCATVLGLFWDGTACRPLMGCTCEGAGCAALFAPGSECASRMQARGCLPLDCRSTGCPADQVCGQCWASWVCAPPGSHSAC